jgi:uncharacterized protein YegJ (DUF2314 family)
MKIGTVGRACMFVFLLAGPSAAENSDPVFGVKAGDPMMLAAYAKARTGLDGFLQQWKDAKDKDRFFVKIGIEDAGDSYAIVPSNKFGTSNGEFFWLAGLKQDGDRYTASINNEPVSIRNVSNGQTIAFGKNDIADWMYMEDGKMNGNFTACPALKNAPEAQRKEIIEQYGLSCD